MNNKRDVELLIKQIFRIPKLVITEISKIFSNIYESIVKKLRFSIAFKINMAFVFMVIGFLIFLNLVIFAGFGFYLGYSAKVDMQKDNSLINSYFNENIESIYEPILKVAQTKNRQISIFDDNHKLLFTSEGDKDKISYYVKDNSSANEQDKYIMISSGTVSMHFGNNSTSTPKFFMVFEEGIDVNGKIYNIQMVNRLSSEFTYLGILLVALAVVNIFAIINTIITGWKASKKILRPVDKMTKTVKNITINALDTRIDVSGSQDELKDLAHTFNSMLDRIQESYEQQNQFVSDASHELRTPIAVIQGYANLLDRWGKNDKEVLEESITAIKSESENMKGLIEQLLFLARGDKNTQKIEKSNFDLDELIDELVRETRLIDEKHEIICEKNEKIFILADRNLIKEALRIFIDNSTKYTPDMGYIKINSRKVNNDIIITIEDSGVGISKEDLPHIFDRFYRADKARTKQSGGTGLGLAIAKWIIMRHKGAIEVESKVGSGTKISISLPIN